MAMLWELPRRREKPGPEAAPGVILGFRRGREMVVLVWGHEGSFNFWDPREAP